eukprot:4097131-Prymnesium_polylepis.1
MKPRIVSRYTVRSSSIVIRVVSCVIHVVRCECVYCVSVCVVLTLKSLSVVRPCERASWSLRRVAGMRKVERDRGRKKCYSAVRILGAGLRAPGAPRARAVSSSNKIRHLVHRRCPRRLQAGP